MCPYMVYVSSVSKQHQYMSTGFSSIIVMFTITCLFQGGDEDVLLLMLQLMLVLTHEGWQPALPCVPAM